MFLESLLQVNKSAKEIERKMTRSKIKTHYGEFIPLHYAVPLKINGRMTNANKTN